MDITPEPQEEVNLANAVDLSDSEEEEELEDIIDDFAFANEAEEVRGCISSLFCGVLTSPVGYEYPTRTPLFLPVPQSLPHIYIKCSAASRS